MEDDYRQQLISEREVLASQLSNLIRRRKLEQTNLYDINIARTKFRLRSMNNKLK